MMIIMTTKEKQLLLKDICGRLPYNVIIRCTDNDTDYKCFLTTDILNELLHNTEYYDYKPYLRPMSSMTEEERNEYLDVKMQECERVALAEVYRPEAISIVFDWLNAHHFDYRGLIKKGLALEAPEDMYDD